ncbi:MAG: peptidoglycan-binding domain-containing protein [Candidatus Solibacter sp.]
MPSAHTIQSGEGVTSLAFDTGHFPDTIWLDGANAGLRKTREHPNILRPGDVVVVPDLRPKSASCATNQRHRFRRRGIPPVLRLQLYEAGIARAAQAYTLVIDDGAPLKGVTDAQGVLQEYVPPKPREGLLTIGPKNETMRLQFQHLWPVHTIEGVQMRLINLLYLQGSVTGVEDEATQSALTAFQKDCGIAETGTADEATLAKLLEIHDQVSPHPSQNRPPGPSGE